MTKPRTAPRATGAPGVKQLITAASLAATLAGWALLTPRETAVQPAAEPQFAPGQAQAPLVLAAPIMPTLAPVAVAATAAPLAERPVQQAPAPAAQAPAAQAPAAAQAPIQAAPAAQAPVAAPAAPVAAPALREVTAPPPAPAPAPVTSTRSSR